MTNEQAVLLALKRLKIDEVAEPLAREKLDRMIPTALHLFAGNVAKNKTQRFLLRKDFSISVTSGSGAITTPLTASEPMLISEMKGWLVSNASDTTALFTYYQYLPDLGTFSLPQLTGMGYYTVHNASGSVLRIIDSTGSRTATATVLINSAYVPTITNVPVQLEDDFVEAVAQVYLGEGIIQNAA